MRIYLQSVVTFAILLAAVALLFMEINVPVGIDDSASAVRGSLGVSLEELSLSNNPGECSFLLNGGFALLSGVFAYVATARRHRAPMSSHDHRDHWPSGDSAASI